VFLTEYGDSEPRDAAIKLVLAEAHDTELLAQWERAARLSHPHLLRLLHMGSCQANRQTFDYVVTEYAEENLAAVLAERPLTAMEAREMLRPALDALAYIHGEGLFHGHLKPANFMAIGDELRLSVDGISRVGDLGPAPCQPGPYDPPEFCARGCSPVGDIWSLGVTLVEALTQQLPRRAEPKREPALPETLPAEFVPLVRSCLQPDPRRRANTGAIAAQLERIFSKPEKQPPAGQPAAPPAAPRPWRVAMLAAGIVFAVVATLAGSRLFHRPVPAGAVAAPAVPPAPKPETRKPGPRQVATQAGSEGKPSPLSPAPPPVSVSSAARVPPGNVAGREGDAAKGSAAGEAVPGRGNATGGMGAGGAPDAGARSIVDRAGVVHQVLPDVPEMYRRTIRGKVTISVRASVDASGHVTDVKLESGASRYFANLTLEAARQWVFEPGKDGASAHEWLLRFDMTSEGTVVQPSRVSP
jgi:serine/threonine-protein kinase Stk1